VAEGYPSPNVRRLRIFSFDPALAARFDLAGVSGITIEIPWEEDLQPGPVGEYIEVVDVDPASDAAYAPVDLNVPALLATDGLQPSESNPQFHQQMVYAVAMKTIEHFERALGRKALWAPRMPSYSGLPAAHGAPVWRFCGVAYGHRRKPARRGNRHGPRDPSSQPASAPPACVTGPCRCGASGRRERAPRN
jgi:hypothetical protein